ncbi:MAG TPA: M1 family metallopeptidase [Bacteroidia bacterium]|nr:M1 family metallopeptidase [Bacteroidia bacterium]
MRKIYILIFILSVGITACGDGDKMTSQKSLATSSTSSAKKLNLDSIAAVTPQKVSPDTAVKVAFQNYQASAPIINQLVHTKLEVSFDWKKKYLYGKATITLKPYFYSVDTLVLDAKGLELHEVSMVNGKEKMPLKYTYVDKQIHINLGRQYKKGEEYIVFIDYTSKPEELKDEQGGSAAITSHKGLFFINANDSDKTKPREVWTQGETEDNSCWFPTIDKPDQRMTEEIYMTIENDFKTLSNGALVSSVVNKDGTRTDHWSMNLNIPPYLVMMAAGPFAVVHDSWHGKDVDYFVDKKYEPYAKDIFGNTPEMIDFFSRVLKFPYPWNKYDQVVAHDYVSGAMENTTATLLGEFLQHTRRELIDNKFDNAEDDISHELFHHWFGDLVTCESWSNLTVNESFANYSEYLWRQYKYGADEADELLQKNAGEYINNTPNQHNLVDFYYKDREDMFDLISYNKGGCILHMLRSVIGDSAFFDALHLYLETNKFSPAEATQLRLAFEKTTGQDLNWFFNEWYYNKGYPQFDIKHSYDASKQQVTVEVNQMQDLTENALYEMPVYIDVYYNGTRDSHRVTISKNKDKFVFNCSVKPDWVDFDSQKMLLCVKNEDVHTDERIFEYNHATKYLARYEALRSLSTKLSKTGVRQVMISALHDRYWYLRRYAINKLSDDTLPDFKNELKNMAVGDSSSLVRATAIGVLAKNFSSDGSLMSIFHKALNDSSYTVESDGLSAIAKANKAEAMKDAGQMEKSDETDLLLGIADLYSHYGSDSNSEFFVSLAGKVTGFEPQIYYVAIYGQFLKLCNNDENINKGIDILGGIYQHSTNKIAKFYARSSLQQIVAWYEDRDGTVNEKITEMQKNSPNDPSISQLQDKLKNYKAQEKKVNDIIGQ